jgi:hypothetical protein
VLAPQATRRKSAGAKWTVIGDRVYCVVPKIAFSDPSKIIGALKQLGIKAAEFSATEGLHKTRRSMNDFYVGICAVPAAVKDAPRTSPRILELIPNPSMG